MEDGIVKSGTHAIEQGVGVRAISGEKTGFAYSDELRLPALMEAAGAARAGGRPGWPRRWWWLLERHIPTRRNFKR